MSKTAEAFRTISEVADELGVPKHVLRFWEGRFPQVRPMKRGGGRRYYRPEDLALLRGICHLLHAEGYTIKGVQKILREQGIDQVKQVGTQTKTDAAGQAPVSAKRGRRATKPSSGLLGGTATMRSGSKSSKSPEERARILAAITQLEACRSILLGKAIESAARRPAAKSRRAARP
jgi:DNA-binding transcriptional MerR regulator